MTLVAIAHDLPLPLMPYTPSRAVYMLPLRATDDADFVTFAEIYGNFITDCGEVANSFSTNQCS